MTNMQTQNATGQQTAGQQNIPLSNKDLSYIKDLMNWELVAAKKAYQYACQTLEPECRQVMMTVAKQHQQNCEQIATHLGQCANQVVQATISSGSAAGTSNTTQM